MCYAISGSDAQRMSAQTSAMALSGLTVALLAEVVSISLAIISGWFLTPAWRWLSLGPAREPVTVFALSIAAVMLSRVRPGPLPNHTLGLVGTLLVAAYLRCMLAASVDVGCAARAERMPVACRVVYYL